VVASEDGVCTQDIADVRSLVFESIEFDVAGRFITRLAAILGTVGLHSPLKGRKSPKIPPVLGLHPRG
jgi:hypothetical protein